MSLKSQPTAEGFVRLSQLHLARQSFDEMEASLNKALALDSREGGVYMVRGDAFAAKGRWAESLASFQKALDVDAVKWSKEALAKLEQVRTLMR